MYIVDIADKRFPILWQDAQVNPLLYEYRKVHTPPIPEKIY